MTIQFECCINFKIYMLFNSPYYLLILLNSTMKKQNQKLVKDNQHDQSFSKPQSSHNVLSNVNLYQKLIELLSIQYEVNSKLLINMILTDQYIKQIDETIGKTSSSEGSTLVSGKQKNMIQKDEKRPHQMKNQQREKKSKSMPKQKQKREESQYQPSDDQQVVVQYKLSQSKNVPKNYGKSILAFTRKNQAFVKKVLVKYDLKLSDFKLFIGQFKNSINTIQQLRSLWTDSEDNPFSKVLRIISAEYLRKHCLGHIFNSRVQNYGKHVKYRHKIMEAVQKPEQFTQMKDF